MPRFGLSLCILSLSAATALAQPAKLDPRADPNRPIDYSNLIGRYDIKVAAEPTAVEVERPILVRVEIIGEGPKTDEPRAKDLRLFPEAWEKGISPDFYPPLLVEEKVDRAKKTWTFLYRLTPKHVGVDFIYGIRLVYYDPSAPDDNKFLREPVDQIKIAVRPRPDAPAPIAIDVDSVPDSFRSMAPVALTREPAPFIFTWVHWLIALALPPLLCGTAALAYRRFLPNEDVLAEQYRHGAAERAVAQLRLNGTCVWAIVCQYLQERFDFPVADPAPAEVYAFLKRAGFAIDVCVRCQTFLQACDAIRFGVNASSEKDSLADDAVRLIQALEADPCARR
ncbi:MAG: hypothetical protein HYR84_00390 [Planctomycetes bacterium]|nr:hypothetical protein [Planctomycetota bacterium]